MAFSAEPTAVAGTVGVIVGVMALMKYFMAPNKQFYKRSLPKANVQFNESDPEIIVIGGGIAGACFAARFGMDGRRVVMIEKNMGTEETCRGEGLQPGGIHKLEELGMKDVLDDVDGNMITDFVFYDIRLGGDPAIIRMPKPGMLVMCHSYLVDALRKKVLAQNSVSVIEGVGKELLKENGRVVGVKYRRKGHDEIEEMRAPLVVLCDGHYPHLSTEFQSSDKTGDDSSWFLAFFLDDHSCSYGDKSGRNCFEMVLGNPHALFSAYYLNDRDIRSFAVGKGAVPADFNKFLEERIAPTAPEHMRESYLRNVKTKPPVSLVRQKTFGPNVDVTPGVLVLGDALSNRHPVTGAGMTVAIKDVDYWWQTLSTIKDLSDDNTIRELKLRFREERQQWALVAGVLAEFSIRLMGINDESVIKLEQNMIKSLRSVPEEERIKPNPVSGLFGATIDDLPTLKAVLYGTLEGTIQEIYDTQSYFSAVWQAMKVRRKFNELMRESTKPFGVTGI